MDKCDYEPLSACLKTNHGNLILIMIIGDRSKCLKEWNEFTLKCSSKNLHLKDSDYIKRDEQPLMLYHY